MNFCLRCVAAIFLVGAAHADGAPDYPQNETLYPLQGDISWSVLHIDCLPGRNDRSITCDVTQIAFDKPKQDDITDENLDELLTSFLEPLCDDAELQDVWAAFDDLSPSDAKMQELLKEVGDEGEQYLNHLKQACLTSDPEERRSILRQLVEQQNANLAKRCKMMIIPKSEQYEWNEVAQQWQSTTEQSYCGGVSVKTIKADRRIWWTYFQQSIFSDTKGKSGPLGISCEELAAAGSGPLIWASKGNAIRNNCQVIGESWTR